VEITVPRAKKCFGYNTKYPRMRSDQKTYYIKIENKCQKVGFFKFQLMHWKVMVPRAKKGFGYNTKYPRMRSDQKAYF
jgi:hypothetical protein